MEWIREDFSGATEPLTRLSMYGEQFHHFNTDDWVAYKNQGDFDRIYTTGGDVQAGGQFIYGTGRDVAINWSSWLSEFNSVGDYPTLTTYIEFVELQLPWQVAKLEEVIANGKTIEEYARTSWSLLGMLDLTRRQLNILKAVKLAVEDLKETALYKRENRIPMKPESTQPSIVVHGNIQQLIGAVDNSTLITKITGSISAGDFNALSQALRESNVSDDDISELQVALKSDPTPANAESFGPATSSWIGKMLGKSASGGWKFSLSVAGSVLAKAIATYYGF
jgi:hypothetical protein